VRDVAKAGSMFSKRDESFRSSWGARAADGLRNEECTASFWQPWPCGSGKDQMMPRASELDG